MLQLRNDGVLLLRTQLSLMLFPLIVALTFVMGYFSYNVSFYAIQKQSISNVDRISTLVNRNLDTTLTQVIQLAKTPLYDQNIQQITTYYAHHPEITVATQQDEAAVDAFLLTVITRYNAIGSIYIYTGGNVSFNESFDRTDPLGPQQWQAASWYRTAMRDSGNPVIIPPHIVEAGTQPTSVFSVAQAIVDTQTTAPTFKTVGTILFNIDSQAIEQIISSSQENTDTRFLIYDARDRAQSAWVYQDPLLVQMRSPLAVQQIVAHGQKDFSWAQTDYSLSSSSSPLSGWTVVALVPIASLTRDIAPIKQTTLLIAFTALPCIMIISLLLISRASGQVTQLRRLMKQVETGNLDVRFASKGHGEIAVLGTSFNHMVARLKQLLQDNYEARLQRQQAELSALQSQVNPHFLYNTLASFQMIATTEGSERVARMSYMLGQLMNYSLLKEEVVELGQDLEHTKNFLLLMQEQYEDRLHFEVRIPVELYRCKVPKFLLQPLVENAIYHGIDAKVEAGHIGLYGVQREHMLLIEIVDNGVGMTPEVFTHLRATLHYDSNMLKRSKHIGILNIHGRLQRLFGPQSGIELDVPEEGGLKVTVRIAMEQDTEKYL